MTLSKRHADILYWLTRGLENSQVAAVMYLSESCIEQNRKKLMALTRSGNAVQLGVWAREHGYHIRQVTVDVARRAAEAAAK